MVDEARADLAVEHRVRVITGRGALIGAPQRALVGRRLRAQRGRQRASAPASVRTSSRVCAALSDTRNREVPWGTVGGRIAGTRNPASSRRREVASASPAVPTMKG